MPAKRASSWSSRSRSRSASADDGKSRQVLLQVGDLDLQCLRIGVVEHAGRALRVGKVTAQRSTPTQGVDRRRVVVILVGPTQARELAEPIHAQPGRDLAIAREGKLHPPHSSSFMTRLKRSAHAPGSRHGRRPPVPSSDTVYHLTHHAVHVVEDRFSSRTVSQRCVPSGTWSRSAWRRGGPVS